MLLSMRAKIALIWVSLYILISMSVLFITVRVLLPAGSVTYVDIFHITFNPTQLTMYIAAYCAVICGAWLGTSVYKNKSIK
jgi:hypothetical protein